MHTSHPGVARRSLSSFRAEADSNQYGGGSGIKLETLRNSSTSPDIDGALVGGASLAVDNFVAIRPRWNLKGKPCNSSSLFCTLFWRSS